MITRQYFYLWLKSRLINHSFSYSGLLSENGAFAKYSKSSRDNWCKNEGSTEWDDECPNGTAAEHAICDEGKANVLPSCNGSPAILGSYSSIISRIISYFFVTVLPAFCKWCCIWLHCWRDKNKETTAHCSSLAYWHRILFPIRRGIRDSNGSCASWSRRNFTPEARLAFDAWRHAFSWRAFKVNSSLISFQF